MSLVAFTRLRMLWGAFDWQHGTENPYTSALTYAGGPDALGGPSSIGVRRCLITIDRTSLEAGMDPAEMHFDWLNFTGGTPDDTWTTGDFTTLEGLMRTYFASAGATNGGTGQKVTQYQWYRVGDGISPPNPAVRQWIDPTPVNFGGTVTHPPQVACSLTFRTAVRHSWGRTYLPVLQPGTLSSGRWATSMVDNHANYLNTMVTGAAASDFALVVVSKPLHAALAVEKIEVDDVPDIIRRRRHKRATYKKLLP